MPALLATRPTRRIPKLSTHLADCFYRSCFWLSLLLSVWLSTGWIGLLLNWQTFSGGFFTSGQIAREQDLL